MLQRAASNAYSWWWASHIRTDQSKWLDGNLQEMEERVQIMLKIIEEDADSFARRAEMYYKKRPELINHVEETYRAYRALADRYDRISGELHKANHTLATAFPDVQFPMQDEDDDISPEAYPPTKPIEVHRPPPPEFPQMSLIKKRSENKPAAEKSDENWESQLKVKKAVAKINEEHANKAIDRLQKGILVLQTEKEFIKSSYESGVAKYWEIEKQITEMQEEVTNLQDEVTSGAVIEDDEARTLMAATALKSCMGTLLNLEEHQKKLAEETRKETKKIIIAKEKLQDLKIQSETVTEEISDKNSATATKLEEGVPDSQQENLELHSVWDKFKDHFEVNSDISVVQLAERIDEVVNKVISLELDVSSQNAQMNVLISESNNLQKHLQSLEEEKASICDDSNNLSSRSNKMQDNDKCVNHEKSVVHTDFTDSHHSLNDRSERLHSPKHQNQVKAADLSQEKNKSLSSIGESKEKEIMKMEDSMNAKVEEQMLHRKDEEDKIQGEESMEKNKEKYTTKTQDSMKVKVEEQMLHSKDQDNQLRSEKNTSLSCMEENEIMKIQDVKVKVEEEPIFHHRKDEQENHTRKLATPEQENKMRERISQRATGINHLSSESEAQSREPKDIQLLSSGLEGKEEISLAEYTSVLGNYKEAQRKLREIEKENQALVKDLKSSNATKDSEILSLRQMLSSLQKNSNLQNSEMLGDVDLEAASIRDMYSEVQGAQGAIEAPHHKDEPQTMSPIEEKLRKDIDTLLDENLEFWLRFSTSFHQIQRFQTEFQSLQADITKLKDIRTGEGSNNSAESESASIGRQLRELKTELQVWVEQNALMRGELQSRFSSLCSIQEEISGGLKTSAEADFVQFTPYQAAKFQGEVLNMKQENNKVADELQAGLSHVKGLQEEAEKALSAFSKLHEKLELTMTSKGSQHHRRRHLSNKNKVVPLQNFLYGGTKTKKSSIFSSH